MLIYRSRDVGVWRPLSHQIYIVIFFFLPHNLSAAFLKGGWGEAALPQSQFLISDQVIMIINFRRTICQLAPIPFLGFLQHPKTILVSISDYGRQRSRV